jgi:predicted AAA+ superfamily ATPase
LKNRQINYLQQLFRDILFRDIIARYSIRNAKIVEGIALFLISNVGKEYSLNGIKNSFGVGSTNSVSDYVAWLEDSYLLFSLPRFSWSLKTIAVNPRKIYTIDTGFAQANSLSFTEDKGRLFENMVYLKLRKSGKELFYFREKGECDFVVKEKNKITELVQACYILTTDNLQRELNGVKEAMDFFDLNEGIIVTLKQTDLFILEGKKVHVVAAMNWF